MGINRTSFPGPGVRFMTKISQSTDLKGRTSSSQRSGPRSGNFSPNLKSHGSRCPNCPNSKCQLGSFLYILYNIAIWHLSLPIVVTNLRQSHFVRSSISDIGCCGHIYAEVNLNGGSFSEISGVSAPRRISRVDISVHLDVYGSLRSQYPLRNESIIAHTMI